MNLFLLISATLGGQSEWDHCLAKGESHEVEIYEDIAYVGGKDTEWSFNLASGVYLLRLKESSNEIIEKLIVVD